MSSNPLLVADGIVFVKNSQLMSTAQQSSIIQPLQQQNMQQPQQQQNMLQQQKRHQYHRQSYKQQSYQNHNQNQNQNQNRNRNQNQNQNHQNFRNNQNHQQHNSQPSNHYNNRQHNNNTGVHPQRAHQIQDSVTQPQNSQGFTYAMQGQVQHPPQPQLDYLSLPADNSTLFFPQGPSSSDSQNKHFNYYPSSCSFDIDQTIGKDIAIAAETINQECRLSALTVHKLESYKI